MNSFNIRWESWRRFVYNCWITICFLPLTLMLTLETRNYRAKYIFGNSHLVKLRHNL